MSRSCTASKSNGDPCKCQRGLRGDPPLCLFHDPERKEELTDFQERGRQAQRLVKRPRRLETQADLGQALTWLWSEVSGKRLGKDEAQVLLRLIDAKEKMLGDTFTEELATELKRLRSDLATIKGKVA